MASALRSIFKVASSIGKVASKGNPTMKAVRGLGGKVANRAAQGYTAIDREYWNNYDKRTGRTDGQRWRLTAQGTPLDNWITRQSEKRAAKKVARRNYKKMHPTSRHQYRNTRRQPHYTQMIYR